MSTPHHEEPPELTPEERLSLATGESELTYGILSDPIGESEKLADAVHELCHHGEYTEGFTWPNDHETIAEVVHKLIRQYGPDGVQDAVETALGREQVAAGILLVAHAVATQAVEDEPRARATSSQLEQKPAREDPS